MSDTTQEKLVFILDALIANVYNEYEENSGQYLYDSLIYMLDALDDDNFFGKESWRTVLGFYERFNAGV